MSGPLLLRAAGAGRGDRLGEGLGGGRRKAAQPGGFDLLDALGLGGSALALVLGMPGHGRSFRWSSSGCARGVYRPAFRSSPILRGCRCTRSTIRAIWSRRRSWPRSMAGSMPGRRRRPRSTSWREGAIGDRHVRRRPAVRLPGAPAAARDRRRPADRADLARAGPAPRAARRSRRPGPGRPGTRLPLAGVLRGRRRAVPRPRRRRVDQPRRDPGRRAAHPAGADPRDGGLAGPPARRRGRRPGGHAARPLGARVRARVRGRGGRASRPSATSPRSPTTSRGRTPRPRSSCCARSAPTSAPRSRPRTSTGEARELRTRLDEATAADETTRTYVERLEAMYDEQRLPSGDDLITRHRAVPARAGRARAATADRRAPESRPAGQPGDAPAQSTSRCVARTGRVTVNALPIPARLVTAMRPPCRLAIRWAIARPSPLPSDDPGVRGPVEALEDPGQVRLGDADPRVRDLDGAPLRRRPGRSPTPSRPTACT